MDTIQRVGLGLAGAISGAGSGLYSLRHAPVIAGDLLSAIIPSVSSLEVYLFRRLPSQEKGLLQWLRACPETDWFQPVDSESTDSL
jgi:hypothetical protein